MRCFLPITLLFVSLPALASHKDADPQTHIQPQAKVFIEPMSGFESDLTAALLKKHVPVAIVADKSLAQYILSGNSQATQPGWAKTIWVGSQPAIHANITVTSVATGQIVYAYTWDKIKAYKGNQSAAEGIAKHLKSNIEGK